MYNGQLDIIVAAPLTTRFLGHLEWNGRNAFDVAPRSVWHSGNDVAGYAKTVNVTGQPLFHHVRYGVDKKNWGSLFGRHNLIFITPWLVFR